MSEMEMVLQEIESNLKKSISNVERIQELVVERALVLCFVSEFLDFCSSGVDEAERGVKVEGRAGNAAKEKRK